MLRIKAKRIFAALLTGLLSFSAIGADLPKHMQLLASTAQEGDADAQFLLGQYYRDQGSSIYDPEQAVVWLERSAEQMHAYASEALGEMFWAAEGIEQDHVKALELLRRAAELGLMSAIDSVGWMHWYGQGGLTHDCGASIDWFERAMAGGYEPSRNNLAWVLATCPDPEHRDGRKALRLARQHVYELGDESASSLDTLAAAYAEAGDFVTAVEVQQRAIEIASEWELDEFMVRLDSYRDRQAWTDGPQQ